MEKINFVNNSQPALNATNLNKLQDNTEDAIQEVQDNLDELGLEKLNKSDVKGTQTSSDEYTYSCNYINQIDNRFVYSTSETMIGYYKGKPLYRRLYETTEELPGTGGFQSITITHGIANVKEIWQDNSVSRIEQTVESAYSTYTLPLIGYNGNTTDKIYVKVDKTNITIYGQGWGTGWRKIVGVLYTKTTD